MTPIMTRDEALTLSLWQREITLTQRDLKPACPRYCIVWEDPDDPDAPVHVTTPSPMWLAMAMHGNVLPPVSAHEHDGVIHALTEEQAMEYLLQKDVPAAVWSLPTGNRRRFVITKRALVPTDRQYRNAWLLTQNKEIKNAA